MSARTNENLSFFTRELNILNFKVYMDYYNSATEKVSPVSGQAPPGSGYPGLAH